MNTGFIDKYFINPAIEHGIKSYINLKENKTYNRLYTFELSVIRALTIIYGEKSIILPYKIDNEKAFVCNLIMYDLNKNDVYKFFDLLKEYDLFMKDIKVQVKATGIINEIESILIDMIVKRNKYKEFNESELAAFDYIFNPTGGDLKKIKSIVASDNGLIKKCWEDNRDLLTETQKKIITIKPNLLAPDVYNRFGYNIKNIAILDEEEINKINERINKEIYKTSDEEVSIIKKEKFRLTSGNVYVDVLMLLSIIATIVMVGLILLSIKG